MTEQTSEREQRYADAIYDGAEAVDPDERAMVVAAVMAVADAEQAELRAEVERLTHRVAKAEGSRDMALDAAKSRGARAETAEAKVERVEAIAADLFACHDDSLVTSDYPMIARRLRVALGHGVA